MASTLSPAARPARTVEERLAAATQGLDRARDALQLARSREQAAKKALDAAIARARRRFQTDEEFQAAWHKARGEAGGPDDPDGDRAGSRRGSPWDPVDEAERAVEEAQVEVSRREDALNTFNVQVLKLYDERDLRPHRELLAKFLQNAIRTMAGLSIGLVTAVVAVAGLVEAEAPVGRFREAYTAGLLGLGLGFAYFVPLLAAHLGDMRFVSGRRPYTGRLVGKATNGWALALGAVVAALQFAFWTFGMVALARLAWAVRLATAEPTG